MVCRWTELNVITSEVTLPEETMDNHYHHCAFDWVFPHQQALQLHYGWFHWAKNLAKVVSQCLPFCDLVLLFASLHLSMFTTVSRLIGQASYSCRMTKELYCRSSSHSNHKHNQLWGYNYVHSVVNWQFMKMTTSDKLKSKDKRKKYDEYLCWHFALHKCLTGRSLLPN